ncbi:hypothetical protein, partial [Modestobacter altitudinis]|uniref:hypothetical protein n=1 Tax=Modestobacter altitudinis TaxID=2213158 RepID=UPI001C5528C1
MESTAEQRSAAAARCPSGRRDTTSPASWVRRLLLLGALLAGLWVVGVGTAQADEGTVGTGSATVETPGAPVPET